ncbi:cysteine--tRNA ligase [Limibaculum sp. FT325]|uniref:cysteine--tRNA ligase n=1 Tax=Thermohalobaculum sediminis TaxID=2939436 RepID=UPI0020BFECB7|nr:cysteine--tRNA ligase [Limibaculum sediminis]MCL5778767.1 cysteine--tRNA ligase [Limibaculum sediminis]
MTTIKLYNTRTRSKEVFTPIDPANVRMYVCGPTVYDRAHIGNARPVVVFDVLFRLLRHVYREDAVTYVRNFTDVDDKINARAAETRQPGESTLDAIRRITDETTRWYLDDMDALGALRPTHMPRATEYIPQMVAMIEKLIADGHAYEAEGHVLFDVPSWPEYGRLSRRSTDELLAGARVDVAPYKRSAMDFVLWKPSDDDTPGWESPWGRGRPGWHIECSAMSKALLGEQFDIHGGGIDLVFPHHENELAQSCCANHTDLMANVWMHNGFLQVEGEKMSKSLGNFFTVKDLLDKGIPGEVIRFVLLSTKYTEPLDWTEKRVEKAEATLRKWRALAKGVEPSPSVPATVVATLADDLNTPKAIAELHALAASNPAELAAGAALLGLLSPGLGEWARGPIVSDEVGRQLDELIRARAAARAAKDFGTADKLRDAMAKAGVTLKDHSGGKVSIDIDPLRAAEFFKELSDLERRQIFGPQGYLGGPSIGINELYEGYILYVLSSVESNAR